MIRKIAVIAAAVASLMGGVAQAQPTAMTPPFKEGVRKLLINLQQRIVIDIKGPSV